MKSGLKTRIRTSVLLFPALLIMITAGEVPFAIVHAAGSEPWASIAPSRDTDVHKILSVLDNRMPEQPLLEKAKNKISTLSDRQTRRIASLAEQADREKNSMGGDIAFLLITALIILL